MTPNPLSFDEQTPIQKARALLKLLALDAAPVIDAAGRLTGIVTAAACDEWEEFTFRSAPQRFASEVMGCAPVSEIATPITVSIADTAPAYDVVRALVQYRAQRIYVVDHSDELVGVISRSDVLRHLSEDHFRNSLLATEFHRAQI